MPRPIDELFDAYERRKQQERKAAIEKAAKAARDREKAIEILTSQVFAPLEPLIQQIRSRGHGSELVRAFDGEIPHLMFTFSPSRLNEFDLPPQPSNLRFTWPGGEQIETVQDVAGAASRSVSERWRLRDVNEDWTHRQVYALVEAALKNQ